MTDTRSTWVIDGATTRIGFGVRNLTVLTVKGSLTGAEGTIIIDEGEPSLSTVEIAIPATSVDTGNARRDKHLRTADFLDVERFPKIAFHSTRVESVDEKHARITGQLTIRDTTREVILDVTDVARDRAEDGQERARFTATTSIDRHDYGVSRGPQVMIGRRLHLDLDVCATRQPG